MVVGTDQPSPAISSTSCVRTALGPAAVIVFQTVSPLNGSVRGAIASVHANPLIGVAIVYSRSSMRIGSVWSGGVTNGVIVNPVATPSTVVELSGSTATGTPLSSNLRVCHSAAGTLRRTGSAWNVESSL